MNYREFAKKIKDKYPDYQDMDDRDLAQKMVQKFPDYSDVTFEEPEALQPAIYQPKSGDIKVDLPKPVEPGPYGQDILQQQETENRNVELYGEKLPSGPQLTNLVGPVVGAAKGSFKKAVGATAEEAGRKIQGEKQFREDWIQKGKQIEQSGIPPKDASERFYVTYAKKKEIAEQTQEKVNPYAEKLKDFGEKIYNDIPEEDKIAVQDAQKWLTSKEAANPKNIKKTTAAMMVVSADQSANTAFSLLGMVPGGQVAGALPMIAQEKKGFIEAAKNNGISDERVLDRFGDAYAIPSGVIEYGMSSIITAPIRAIPKIGKGKTKVPLLSKAVGKVVKNNVLKNAISNVVGTVGVSALEGTEELTQAELQDAVMYWALTDAAKNSPENAEFYTEKRDAINLKPLTKEKFDNFILGFAASLPQNIASRIIGGAGRIARTPSQQPITMGEVKITPREATDAERTGAEAQKTGEPTQGLVEGEKGSVYLRDDERARLETKAGEKVIPKVSAEGLSDTETQELLRKARVPTADISKLTPEEQAKIAERGMESFDRLEFERKQAEKARGREPSTYDLEQPSDADRATGERVAKQYGLTFKEAVPGDRDKGGVRLSFVDPITGNDIEITAATAEIEAAKIADRMRQENPEEYGKKIAETAGVKFLGRKEQITKAIGTGGKYATEMRAEYQTPNGNVFTVPFSSNADEIRIRAEEMDKQGGPRVPEVQKGRQEEVITEPVTIPARPTQDTDRMLRAYIKTGKAETSMGRAAHEKIVQVFDQVAPEDVAEATGLTPAEAREAIGDIRALKKSPISEKVRQTLAPSLFYGETVDEAVMSIQQPRAKGGEVMFSREQPDIIDEETYLAIRGASRQDIGEAALHKNRGRYSDKAWKKIIDAQAKKDHELIIKRAELRKEYQEKLLSGEIKQPNRLQSLWNTAQGMEENLAVQAARRILERKGYDWKKPLEPTQRDIFGGEKSVSQIERETQQRKKRQAIAERQAERKGGEATLAGLPMFEDQDIEGSQMTLKFQREERPMDLETAKETARSNGLEYVTSTPEPGGPTYTFRHPRTGTEFNARTPGEVRVAAGDLVDRIAPKGTTKAGEGVRFQLESRTPEQEATLTRLKERKQQEIEGIERDKEEADLTIVELAQKRIKEFTTQSIEKGLYLDVEGEWQYANPETNPGVAEENWTRWERDIAASIGASELPETPFAKSREAPREEVKFQREDEVIYDSGTDSDRAHGQAIADQLGNVKFNGVWKGFRSKDGTLHRDPRLTFTVLDDKGNIDTSILAPLNTTAGQVAKRRLDVLRKGEVKFQIEEPRKTSDIFFSPVLRAVQGLKQERGTGDQMFAMITKTPGVKEAEWKWMGLDDFLKGKQSVTRQEIEEFVRGNQVRVEEVQRGESKEKRAKQERLNELARMGSDRNYLEEKEYNNLAMTLRSGQDRFGEAKYGAYNLPGGENYREVLLTLPSFRMIPLNRADADFHSSHWDEPNVIAHIRLDDRTGPNGEKVLFVEEIQSDWSISAREKGVEGQLKELPEGYSIVKSKGPSPVWQIKGPDERIVASGFNSEEQAKADFLKNPFFKEARSEIGSVPAQPFLKNWEELVLKRVLRIAAEEGYDRVAWINGEQTAARYDLSKQIDGIEVNKVEVPEDNKGWHYRAFKEDESGFQGGGVIEGTAKNENELAAAIGKDAAKKSIENITLQIENKSFKDDPYRYELRGNDLKIGGEWATNLYDRMIPKFYEKYGKKWGTKVEPVKLGEGTQKFEDQNPPGYKEQVQIGTQQSIRITHEMKESVLYEGQPMFQKEGQREPAELRREAYEALPETARRNLPAEGREIGKPVPDNVSAVVALTRAIERNFGTELPEGSIEAVVAPQEEAYQVADKLVSEEFGRTPVWFNVSTEAKDAGVRIGGAKLNSQPDVVFLNTETKKPVIVTAVHETMHIMQEEQPDLYYPVLETMMEQATTEFKSYRQQMLDKGYTEREVMDEMVAEISGERFTDPEFLKSLHERSPDAFRAFVETLRRVIQQIKDWIRKSGIEHAGKYFVDLNRVDRVLQDSLIEMRRRGQPEMKMAAQREATFSREAPAYKVSDRRSAYEEETKEPTITEKLKNAKEITESVFEPQEKSIITSNKDVPRETAVEYLTRRLIDKFERLRVIQKHLGKPESNESNAYLKQELMHGRIETQMREIERDYLEPIQAKMSKAGIGVQELDEYLYAKHAKKRNEIISGRNKRFGNEELYKQTAGSGMTDSEADAILKRYENRKDIKAIADEVYKLIDKRLQIMIDGDLITKDQADQWKEQFGESYVPLKGISPDMTQEQVKRFSDLNEKKATGKPFTETETKEYQHLSEISDNRPTERGVIGRGFSIGGKEVKSAYGRRSRVQHILANVINDVNSAIIRSEKNRVGKAFLEYVRTHKDPKLFEIEPIEEQPYFNSDGEVEYRDVPTRTYRDKATGITVQPMVVKEKGKGTSLLIKDVALSNAMQNIGSDKMGKVLQVMSSFSKYFSIINTQVSPEFVVTNLTRDIQTALVNVTGVTDKAKVKGAAADVVKNIPKAIRGAWNGLHGKEDTEWSKLFREYEKVGGKIGWFGLDTVEDIQKRLVNKLSGTESTPKAKALMLWNKSIDLVKNLNGSIENATRLSVYKSMKDRGFTQEEAASVAKNITVNFNKHGELGPLFNSLYAFSNAGIQGSARLAQALKSKKVQKIVISAAVVSFLLAQINRLLSGDDDDEEPNYDKVPVWEKQNNIVIMIGPGRQRIKIPLPYGYNVFWSMGQAFDQAIHGNLERAAAILAGSIANSFNPLGNAGSTIQMVFPTPVRWIADLGINKDFSGKPILKEERYGPQKSQAYLARKETTEVSKSIAKALSYMTFGKEYEPGILEKVPSVGKYIVSPDAYDYVFEYFAGGIGRFGTNVIRTTQSAIAGEPKLQYAPFARRFYGTSSEYIDVKKFYENMDRLERIAAQHKLYLENEQQEKADNYEIAHKKDLEYAGMVGKVKRSISKMNKAKAYYEKEGNKKDADKMQKDIIALMKDINKTVGKKETE